MLKANLRYILYFDLAMTPHPSDAPALPLTDFIPHLRKRCDDDKSFQVIDNERRVVRLSEIKPIKTANGTAAVAMLFALGDKDKAEPGFTDFVTGEVRIAKRRKNEAGGLSVHAVLSLEPTRSGGHLYRMVYEDVTGFGRTLIQGFLRSEFKIISDEQGLTFKREGDKELKTRPMVELSGHASDKLKNSIKQGRLLHIELIDYVEKTEFDEPKYISTARRDMNLSISKELPQSESLNFIERTRIWAHRQGYESMRVRWRDAEITKPQSAKVDTAKQDAGEAFFVKFAEINLKTGLPDISESISDELIAKMKNMVD